MAHAHAFVGHSFDKKKDGEVVRAFLELLTTYAQKNNSFKWETAQQSEPRDVQDKVLERFEGKNLLIAICTRNEKVFKPADIGKKLLGHYLLRTDKVQWKASDWIIQEIGVAIGRGMNVIILLEEDVKEPGTLQGNIERIPFKRNVPSESFPALMQMIQFVEPKLNPVESKEMATSPEKHPVEPEREPEVSWALEEYQMEAMWALHLKNSERFAKLESAFKASGLNTPENGKEWTSTIEGFKIRFAEEGGNIDVLLEQATKHPDHVPTWQSLSLTYAHFKDYRRAAEMAEQALVAASTTEDKRWATARAALMYHTDKNYIQASKKIDELRALATDIEGEKYFLTKIIEIYDEKDLESICARERLLAINPTDIHTRSQLGYVYQELDNNSAPLSLLHYTTFPRGTLNPIALNNLGVAYDRNDLSALAVEAYKKAEAQGYTLAMSNLAYKLNAAGFVEEAKERCENARKITNCVKNVDECMVQLNETIKHEEDQVEGIIESVRKESEFYAVAGRALAVPAFRLNGKWKHEKCVIDFLEADGKIVGQGTYSRERTLGGLAGILSAFGSTTKKTEIWEIRITLTQNGSFLRGEIKDSDADPEARASLLLNDSGTVTMILSPDGEQLEVLQEVFGKKTFFKMKKVHALPVPATSLPVKAEA